MVKRLLLATKDEKGTGLMKKHLLYLILPLILFATQHIPSYANEKSTGPSQAYLDSFKKSFTKQVGMLKAHTMNGPGSVSTRYCIATAISSEYILTAASCAYAKDGSKAANLYFYPGYSETGRVEYGKYPVLKVFHPKDFFAYNRNIDVSRNIAIMKIGPNAEGKTAGSRVGTAGYWGTNKYPDGPTIIVGYAGDDAFRIAPAGCYADARPYDVELKCNMNIKFATVEGAPTLIYSQEQQALYIGGVAVGAFNSKIYASHLSTERKDIIQAPIKKGLSVESYNAENGGEKWISFEPPHNDIVEVWVDNRCSEDLYVAGYYKDLDGTWRTEGFYSVKEGKEALIFQSHNGIYYLNVMIVKNKQAKVLTKNSTRQYFPAEGRDISLQKYHVKKFGSFTHTFNCSREI